MKETSGDHSHLERCSRAGRSAPDMVKGDGRIGFGLAGARREDGNMRRGSERTMDVVSTEHSLRMRNLALFILLVFICISASIAGQMFFPGTNRIVLAIRAVLSCVGLVAIGIGSERLLQSQFEGTVSLGLKPSRRSLVGALLGLLGGLALVAAAGAGFWLCVPFHFERTSVTLTRILPDVQNYLLSNIGEELIFRGYLLLVLARRFGLPVAVFVTAVLFGLFHLTGLGGPAAVKMVFTTAACSFLFAAAFLVTGTIWAAIGVHFAGNVALHKITGLSNGVALFKPVLHDPYPASYDPGFWVFLVVPLHLAFALFSAGARRVRFCVGWTRRRGREGPVDDLAP